MSDFYFFVSLLPKAVANGIYTPPPAKGGKNRGAVLAHQRSLEIRASILEYVGSHSGAGICQIAEQLSISMQTANTHLRKLRSEGQIHRLPGYYGGYSTCKK